MGKIEKFGDLECWQAARMLAKEIYTLLNVGELRRDFETKNQHVLEDLNYLGADDIGRLRMESK